MLSIFSLFKRYRDYDKKKFVDRSRGKGHRSETLLSSRVLQLSKKQPPNKKMNFSMRAFIAD